VHGFIKAGLYDGSALCLNLQETVYTDYILVNVTYKIHFLLVAVCDIGSASFKYDMRRLLEILALPKAWYRRSLARRMFLGEEPTVPDDDSQSGNVLTLNLDLILQAKVCLHLSYACDIFLTTVNCMMALFIVILLLLVQL